MRSIKGACDMVIRSIVGLLMVLPSKALEQYAQYDISTHIVVSFSAFVVAQVNVNKLADTIVR